MQVLNLFGTKAGSGTPLCLMMHNQIESKQTLFGPRLIIVSQATPFAERGRAWSRCNYLVVAEERNYRPLRLGNKKLTSAKHVVT